MAYTTPGGQIDIEGGNQQLYQVHPTARNLVPGLLRLAPKMTEKVTIAPVLFCNVLSHTRKKKVTP
jgi:hypothetical protein